LITSIARFSLFIFKKEIDIYLLIEYITLGKLAKHVKQNESYIFIILTEFLPITSVWF